MSQCLSDPFLPTDSITDQQRNVYHYTTVSQINSGTYTTVPMSLRSTAELVPLYHCLSDQQRNVYQMSEPAVPLVLSRITRSLESQSLSGPLLPTDCLTDQQWNVYHCLTDKQRNVYQMSEPAVPLVLKRSTRSLESQSLSVSVSQWPTFTNGLSHRSTAERVPNVRTCGSSRTKQDY